MIALEWTWKHCTYPLEIELNPSTELARIPRWRVSERKPASVLLPAAFALTAMVGLYVAAYFALVVKVVVADADGTRVVASYSRYPGADVSLRLDDPEPTIAQAIFAPMHQLDRRIRPHIWRL